MCIYCWRRSLRGCDLRLTGELDVGNQKLLAPSPVLGIPTLPTIPTVEAIFKGTALGEQCVVDTIWTVIITEPS